MSKFNIMTVLINKRSEEASDVQQLLTEYGCNIKMRLGLHDVEGVCAEDGLLILQLVGDQDKIASLEKKLSDIYGVKAQLMTIESE